jgi:hypothetical protein
MRPVPDARFVEPHPLQNPEPQPAGGWRQWLATPEVPRALPFVLFLLIGSFQGKGFAGSEYWLYAAKTLSIGALLWILRGYLPEMRWSFKVEAVVVGLGIAVLWIGLDGRIPSLGDLWDLGNKWITGKTPVPAKAETPWNPVEFFSGAPALGWGFVAIRVLGRSLVVPPLEEVFYRSFLYRYLIQPKFTDLPLGVWQATAFIVTSLLFGFSHPGQWLPAVICGAAYQALVVRNGRIGDAMLAHATTNLVISVYAIATHQWQFT